MTAPDVGQFHDRAIGKAAAGIDYEIVTRSSQRIGQIELRGIDIETHFHVARFTAGFLHQPVSLKHVETVGSIRGRPGGRSIIVAPDEKLPIGTECGRIFRIGPGYVFKADGDDPVPVDGS